MTVSFNKCGLSVVFEITTLDKILVLLETSIIKLPPILYVIAASAVVPYSFAIDLSL